MKFWPSLFGRDKPTPAPGASEKSPDGYAVYSTEFDKEVRSTNLDFILGEPTLSEKVELDAAWKAFEGGLRAWRTTAHIRALDISSELRSAISEERLKNTVVTLLIDHSGSMKGQRILLAAAAVDVAHDFLMHLGCTVEILGFTTRSWKGGRSRKVWAASGRPANPGRLCDLLHIVYLAAGDVTYLTVPSALRPMLRLDLLKENVDGEALLWAAGRLAKLPHKNKVLIVVSDGAPVDDSTLMQNGKNYLERHLRQVISALEEDPTIGLAAIGIGHDVGRYYRLGLRASDRCPIHRLAAPNSCNQPGVTWAVEQVCGTTRRLTLQRSF